jgi:predicted Mrr-cat superfamily restriction endonuclease
MLPKMPTSASRQHTKRFENQTNTRPRKWVNSNSTLMDLDDLVKSLLEHYEEMDVEMQRLIPLRKVYWPV